MLDHDVLHCQRCGAQPGQDDPYDPGRPILMTVGSEPLDESGLRRHQTLVCSLCSEGARYLTLDQPSAERLLVQIRRAHTADQIEILRWLKTKFPDY